MNAPPSEDEYEDINTRVSAEWESETTPYQRVRAVIKHAYEPLGVADVADQAQTTPKTARKHLTALADDGFLSVEPGPNGGHQYKRSTASLVVEQAADILAEVSGDELLEQIREMQGEIEAYQDEFGVDDPAEAVVEDTNTMLAEDSAADPSIDLETVRSWQRTQRNLAFANAALSIANAERFVEQDTGAVEAADL